MAEPRVVVSHREHLCWLLAEAAQLEHMMMCQYLYAEFSLKDGTTDGLTGEQAAAVDRWRRTLRGIAVEEMLHLALVSNLMSAIGAAPYQSTSGDVVPVEVSLETGAAGRVRPGFDTAVGEGRSWFEPARGVTSD
jgi:hypothetical protein